jgi:hypothetical protein
MDDSAESEGYLERVIREYGEGFPREGDRLFVETWSAAHVDPLGMSDPAHPEDRSPVGRRQLYSDGYLLAADRLVEGYTESPPEDVLIYPILYLYRHHIELELKLLNTRWLTWLSGLDEAAIRRKVESLGKKHRLKCLWDRFQGAYPECNQVFDEKTRVAFRTLLFELDDHDSEGQSGRYETDSRGMQTLTKLHSIDLPTLKSGIHKISQYLSFLGDEIGREVDRREEIACRRREASSE